MYHQPSKRKRLINLIAVYTIMTIAVVSIVTVIVLFMLGFRLNANGGNLEQYAFLQFSSTPSGATVTVDGAVIGSKTPNKISIPAGKHEIMMWRDGYETWHKTVDIKAGTLTWLNYTLLVPKNLSVEVVAHYPSIYATLASPTGNSMLVVEKSDTPTFNLVDLGSDTAKNTKLVIPTNLYSESTTVGVSHTFQISKWDDGGRYVLIRHIYGAQDEWLALDTQSVASTKNITRLLDVSISDIVFSGTSGNVFYALVSSDIRKLDLSAGTISKTFVNNVSSFDIYSDLNVITYIGMNTDSVPKQVVGIYRDGDDKSSVIRTIPVSQTGPVHIATTHYFNQDYVAISEGKKVDILSGSYPNTTSDNTTSLKNIASFNTTEDVQKLTFSPIGEYVFAQSGAYFASYDLEYQKLASTTIDGTTAMSQLKWLDKNYVWSDRDGKLTIREFDGANVHTINAVTIGQDATLTHNGRYLYSINKTVADYQLQRVRMILP